MSQNGFHFQQDGNHLQVALTIPTFDAQVAENFQQGIAETWSDNIHEVTIDIHSVEFIDSSGVGALLAVRKRLPPNAPPVTLVRPQCNVTSVLEMLRLHRVFRIA